MTTTQQLLDQALSSLAGGAEGDTLGLLTGARRESGAPPESIAQRRRRRSIPSFDDSEMVLVERDGILYFDEPGAAIAAGRRRRARTSAGRVVARVPFDHLPPSEVWSYLQKLDRKLTPNRGLRRLSVSTTGLARHSAGQVPAPKSGRALLFVHGTFSNTENTLTELHATREGKGFLKAARACYGDQIYTFDHPTLAVSPMLNARELACAFEAVGSKAAVDVICHSRGGLVTRWWVEVFDRNALDTRVAFVGSPLAGTGLAAPHRLKSVLHLFVNLGNTASAVAGATAFAFPFMAIVSGLFKVIATATSGLVKTPLVDAGVALVPGLAAMSRVSNNSEILSLRDNARDHTDRYFAVQSNFDPDEDHAWWKVWKLFKNMKARALDAMADRLFDGENDLVVDSASMTDFGQQLQLAGDHIRDFGRSPTVHHVNYFRQKEALEDFMKWFEIPVS